MTLSDRFAVVADGNLLKGSTKDVYLTRFLGWIIKVPDSVFNPLFSKVDRNGCIVNKRAERPGVVYTQLLTLSQK